MDSDYLISLYNQTIEYFSQELGFKPFRKNPSIILVNNVTNGIRDDNKQYLPYYKEDHEWVTARKGDILKIHIHTYTKPINSQILQGVLVAKESLLSFIPEVIRDNPLINAMILYRLAYGNSLFNEVSQDITKKLYILYKISFEGEMANDPVLISCFRAFNLIFPKGLIEISFKQYLYTYANFSQILSSDSNLLNAIIEDVVFKNSLYTPLNSLETNLLSYFCNFFHEKRTSFSPENFFEYLNQNIPEKDKHQIHGFLLEKKINEIFKKFEDRGISFLYRIDYISFGYQFNFFLVEFNEKIDYQMVNYCFENMISNFVLYDNFTSNQMIRAGILVEHKNSGNNLMDFFSSLKNIGIIDDFVIFPYDSIHNFANLKNLSDPDKYGNYLAKPEALNQFSESFIYSSTNKFIPDYVDFILFRLLSQTGANGFWLRYNDAEIFSKFLNELENEMNLLKSQILNFEIIQKNNRSLVQDSTLGEIFNEIFNHYDVMGKNFIELLHEMIGKMGLIRVKILFNEIKKNINYNFSEKYNSQDHNDKILTFINLKILQIIIGRSGIDAILKWYKKISSNNDLLKEVTKKIDALLEYIHFFYQNFDLNLVKERMNFLQLYKNHSDIQLKKDLKKRIYKYLDLKIIEPFLINSLFTSGINCIKILVLKVKEDENKFLDTFTSRIPFGMVFYSSIIKDLLIIFFKIHSNMENIVYKMIKILFSNNITYYGGFMGSFIVQVNKLETLYSRKVTDNVFYEKYNQEIINLLSDYKKEFIVGKQVNNPSESFFLRNVTHENESKKLNQKNRFMNDNLFNESIRLNNSYKQPNTEEIFEVSSIFNKIYQNPSMSLKLCPSIKYGFFPNLDMFRLNYFIIKFRKVNEKKYLIKKEEITPQELFSVPGCFKIEVLNEISHTDLNLLHYIFPKNDFCLNLIKYSNRKKIIKNTDVFSVRKIMYNFLPNYFIDRNGWSSNFTSLDVIIHKILNEEFSEFEPKYLTINLESTKEIFFSGNSEEYNLLGQIYNKNISKILPLKSMKLLKEMIEKKIIMLFPILDLDRLFINHRITIILKKINRILKDKLFLIFYLLPFVVIYDSYNIDINQLVQSECLIIDVFLPNEQLDKFYNSILRILDTLNLREVQIYQNLVDCDVSKYSNQKVKKLINPYLSHVWNQNNSYWTRVDYFDAEGKPKIHQEILNSIKSRNIIMTRKKKEQ